MTKKTDFSETLHGVVVPDPYRWLEDANSPDTRAWIEAENKATFAYLDSLPGRDAIKARLTKLIDYERFGRPEKAGSHYFFTRNDGLQNQDVLYVSDSLQDPGRVLLDPNGLSPDGTVALRGVSISDDGSLLAYSISKAGSDWQEWQVRDVATGRDRDDKIEWSKFSGASWSHDRKGFYYSRYAPSAAGEALQQANYFQKVYYHRLGTPQADDKLIYERPDQKDWLFSADATEDGRYLVITVSQGTERETRIFVKDLKHPEATIELLPKGDAQYSYLANDGPEFYFRTDNGAPNGKVVAVSLAHPAPESWRTVVPEKPQALDGASVVGSKLFCSYLKDAASQVEEYDLKGRLIREVRLPALGTADGFGGRRKDHETFYSIVTYTSPSTIYHYDVDTGDSKVFKQPKTVFDADRYVTERVFYKSKDGTKVPLFITHSKDLVKNGQNPTLLYGYGGFNVSMTPFYSSRMAAWLDMGGVVAVACIRGGGEYGKAWHDAGRLKNKQNVFDDFIAAGEYLVSEGYTSPAKLACNGGSNGGLLVGAVVNQRPDLWGAAIPEVGVMDMLRFNKFTIGWAWVSDFGDPANADDFNVLMKYSPYQNIKPGEKYPAVLVMTGDHDDRVVPAHSFKYTAALQAAQGADKPILIRIETSAGHGAGKPTAKIIDEAADELAFLAANLGMTVTLPPTSQPAAHASRG